MEFAVQFPNSLKTHSPSKFIGNNTIEYHFRALPRPIPIHGRGRPSEEFTLMGFSDPSQLRVELERRVQIRTGRRVRSLAIEVSRARVILKGQASTYYVKQLAQHGVRDLLPHMPLENSIAVERS